MYIEVTQIKFMNFMSYQEEAIYMPENGVVLINGQNGRGKCVDGSTEIDISFPDKNIEELFLNFLKKNKIKNIKKSDPRYWQEKGFSEEEAYLKSQKNKLEKKATKKRLSPFDPLFWQAKGFSEEESIFKVNSFRPTYKEYWLVRGFSEEESILRASNQHKDNSKKGNSLNKSRKKFKGENQHSLEYWLLRGFSEEESKQLLKERQSTFSLKKCIEKYGESEGQKVFNERQLKWQETLNSKSQEELDDINIRKCSIYLKDTIEDTISYYKIARNMNLVETIQEYIEIIKNKINDNYSLRYANIDLFISSISKIQKQIFGLSDEEIKNEISFLFSDIFYLENRGNKQAYRKYSKCGCLLRSSYEILFYELFNNKFPERKIEIDKQYPNSKMRFDFKIDNIFVEICPMYGQNDEYTKKMDFKNEKFGAILLKNKLEIEKFIEDLL